jgi:hypothetical protein
MDKKKAKKRIERLQEYQAQKEMKEMQGQGNSIGIMIDKLKTTDNPMPESTEALLKPSGGKYRIDQQHFALMFLETFQKEDPITGDMKPKYKNVSDMLLIDESTLKDWWNKRDELMAQQSTMMIEGMNYLSTAFMVELIRMTEAMRSVNYNEMVAGSPADMKNFILLFNTVLNKFRLLSNQSTSNVAHEHKVQMIVPEDD